MNLDSNSANPGLFSRTLTTIMTVFSCLSNDNKTRPMISFTTEKIRQTAVYDTGSSISLLSMRAWRKIDPKNRPKRMNVGLTAVSASGEKLQLHGCYLLETVVLGKTIKHPFYVCTNLKADALLGIDYINAAGLNYDATLNEVYLADSKSTHNVDLITRSENYIMPRSGLLVSTALNSSNVRPISNNFVMDINIPGCPQIAKNEGIISPNENGLCNVYLVNTGVTPLRIPRGTKVGHGYFVPDNLIFEVDSIGLEPKTKEKYDKLKRQQILKERLDLSHLSMNLQKQYLDLLCEYHDVFSLFDNDLGQCTLGEHDIQLKDTNPAYVRQFPLPEAHREVVINTVKEWLNLGIIEKSNSPYNAPIFVVPKKLGLPDETGNQQMTFRVVCDYRTLNLRSTPQKFRLPLIQECLDEIGRSQASIFTSLDMKGAFFQINVRKSKRFLTSFTVPNMGTFQFVRCPFGLSSTPLTFQRLVNKCFENLTPHVISCYQDDGLIKASSHPEMLKNLKLCLDRLRISNLKLSVEKSRIAQSELTFLGYTINKDGYRPNKNKLKSIQDCLPPKNSKQIRSWLGMTNFFRASIPNYAKLSRPLSKLICKDSKWTGGPLPPEALKAFNTLKQLLMEEPVLAFPMPNMPYHLYCDGSQGRAEGQDGSISGCLVQIQFGIPKVIGYCSRSLKPFEKNYQSVMVEMLAATFSIEYFRTYLTGVHFTLHSDAKILTKISSAQKRTLNRLQMQMMEFNFTHAWVKGDENIADYTSRQVASVITQQKIENSKLPFLSDKDVIALQRDDPFICALANYVNKKSLPSSMTALRSLVKRYGPACALKNGILCILLERKGYEKRWLKVAPAILHADILCSAHASQFCGHAKGFKTAERILLEWWFPNLRFEAEQYIKECEICQKSQKSIKRPNTDLKPIELPSVPLMTAHCDLFGPLRTKSGSGKAFILTLVDPKTKHAEFCAIESKEPEVVAKAIFDRWICRYGIMSILISDQGVEFTSKINKQLYDLLKIDKRQTSGYHPICNGSSEVLNKTIATYLTSMLDKNVLDWETLLPALQFSYNSSTSSSTKATPFYLLYGVHPRTPFSDPNFSDRVMYGENYAQTLFNRLKFARKLAYENNRKFQDNYESNYNSKVKKVDFSVGSLVLLHRPEINKVNPKLSKNFQGPYIIISLPNETNALIQDLKSNKTRFVHKNRLKPFLGPLSATDTLDKNIAEDAHDADTPKVQNSTASSHTQKADTGREKFIRIESDDCIILNPDVTPPRPIPVKTEDQETSSDSGDNIVIKEESQSPSPIKVLTDKVKSFKDKLHIPSTSEVGESMLPSSFRRDFSASSSSRMTREKAKKEGITIDDKSLPPRPIEYKGKKKKQ